jgi:hypothetical protein
MIVKIVAFVTLMKQFITTLSRAILLTFCGK